MKRKLIVGAIVSFFLHTTLLFAQADTGWKQVPLILARIKAPTFPKTDFNILQYGAKTNGSLSTTAIQQAINACSNAGGGRVVVPKGSFLTGALHLKSNVNLYISYGATLKFSTNIADYLPVVLTRFEGVECYNYSPFLYAFEQQNIAITGSGTLDGQAASTNWWGWKSAGAADVKTLNTMGQNGVPVDQRMFGEGKKIRPCFVQPYRCQNVLIDSVTILRSPMWEVNPVLCTNVTVSHLNINSHGVNNDGCNPESSKDVWIYRCLFDTGDDCIAIKSGRNNDGRRVGVPSENIVIQECTMKDGHGGVTMGSECSGGIRNVFAENCVLSSSNLDCAFRIKTNSVRGGVIENIFLRKCTVGTVADEVFQVNMQYEEGDAGTFTPVVRHLVADSIIGNNCPAIFMFKGYSRSPVSDFKISNSTFNGVVGNTLLNVEKLQIYTSFSNGTVPLVPTELTGYQHAEAYTSQLGWGWSNVRTGFTGNAYMEPCTNQNLLEWKVNSSTNTWDTLVWNYATRLNTVSLGSVEANGYLAQSHFPASSASWKTVKTPFPAQIGSNRIRFISSDTSAPMFIDRFYVLKGKVLVTDLKEEKREKKEVSMVCFPQFVDSSAEITLFLPNPDHVELNLFSANGGKVATVFEGPCRAGETHFTLKRGSYSSGAYFLRLYTSKEKKIVNILLGH